ncbi:3-isopropylmalate dehydratase small subunit 2 [Halovivax sp.]|uniref:3-isopropylmalate dehydratase small subunit n=1 Tax=Halovivax sp. TaxID=1935978 RepID=UPI0025C54CB6|nr:3-isopropylmalate dehydratase small subunit [Halovivax sp.]
MAGVEELQVRRVGGTGVPIRGDDVDTDQILPARFLKEVTFENMADYLFYDARRDEDGTLNDHPLNRFEGARIMVVNDNFGCGSSREHAPQAIDRWGIDGIVGESFAEIFQGNCESLGLPAATADPDEVAALQDWIDEHPDGEIALDVEEETLSYGDRTVAVEIDDAMREALVEGIWDTTALMRSNLDATRETAAKLPYVDG